jgi:anti-sigma regulatory factor (Ser/Thr protein kinase)
MEAKHQVMTGHNRPQLTSGLTLAAVPTAVRFARLFVRQRLSLWGLNRLIGDAELVLSELVTNAINATGTTNPRPRWSELHNQALITIRLVVTADSLVIEVCDRDARPPVLKQPEEADEAGRGLLIVGALCRRWNYFHACSQTTPRSSQGKGQHVCKRDGADGHGDIPQQKSSVVRSLTIPALSAQRSAPGLWAEILTRALV